MKRLALVVFVASVADAAPADPLAQELIVFARGDALIQSDARGKNEQELAKLPAGAQVKSLHADAGKKALLIELDTGWAWLPLDHSTTTPAKLPCAAGPAQLGEDATCVLCRSAADAAKSVIVNLATLRATPVAIPAPGTRIAGTGADRRLVWADATGVWTAPPATPTEKTQIAPEGPLRDFLPSHDAARAVGVYAEQKHDGKKLVPEDQLVGFALDGVGAHRKGLPHGTPVDWSHDNQYVMVQDGDAACLVRAMGGQYKCWKGYRALGLARDGAYILMANDKPGLWRGVLAGPNTAPPTQVTSSADPAAVWL